MECREKQCSESQRTRNLEWVPSDQMMFFLAYTNNIGARPDLMLMIITFRHHQALNAGTGLGT